MSDVSSVFNVPFKLVFSGTSIPEELYGMTYYYDVDFSNNIHNLMNNINYNIKCDFGLSTFELIPHQFGENGLDIKQHIINQYSNNYEMVSIGDVIPSAGFYVRPISLTEEDMNSLREIYEQMMNLETCPVCFTRRHMSRYFACEHEICHHCYASWNSRMEREERATTCPVCRGT